DLDCRNQPSFSDIRCGNGRQQPVGLALSKCQSLVQRTAFEGSDLPILDVKCMAEDPPFIRRHWKPLLLDQADVDRFPSMLLVEDVFPFDAAIGHQSMSCPQERGPLSGPGSRPYATRPSI